MVTTSLGSVATFLCSLATFQCLGSRGCNFQIQALSQLECRGFTVSLRASLCQPLRCRDASGEVEIHALLGNKEVSDSEVA